MQWPSQALLSNKAEVHILNEFGHSALDELEIYVWVYCVYACLTPSSDLLLCDCSPPSENFVELKNILSDAGKQQTKSIDTAP